ncbi:Indole-3-acetic acid inducible 14 isoform 2 [Hibiscus syriacus]|uniref:Auxin-responsive protein n=1 Tax=Hibiscus syriacus TaxID=106335 RepID=A0A6A3B9R4_HIBSY|nr:Indole-3-acetic acid inducible 14 isoform 2 [Hibiscus syriacus]
MANMQGTERDLNYKETELCLGLPGGGGGGASAAGGGGGENEVESSPKTTGKRGFSGMDLNQNLGNGSKETLCTKDPAKPPAKAQVLGWPPVWVLPEEHNGQPEEQQRGNSDYVPPMKIRMATGCSWAMSHGMFVDLCKRLRIMKGSEAVGLRIRSMEKCKSRA